MPLPLRVFIFECNDATQIECFERNLFGAGAAWPLNVKRGNLCFLYNYYGSRNLIYGVYEATCDGARRIEPDAWGGQYQCQVRVKLRSHERIAVPRANIHRLVTDPESLRVRNILTAQFAHDLLQFFAAGYTVRQEQGTQMNAIEEDYRRRFPRDFHCTDGHSVRSTAELTIDEWLSRNQIYHEYERLANIPESLIPDFTVYTPEGRPIFIEYWGLVGDPDYDQRRLRKCEIYARHHCNVIELYKHDVQNLDFALRRKLAECNVRPTANA